MQSKAQNRYAVIYICDRNYHLITQYALASLAMHHSSPLDFHFIQSGYDLPLSGKFTDFIETFGHTIFVESPAFLPLPKSVENSSRAKRAHISEVAFQKAGAIEMLSAQYDGIAYVDGDVLTFTDVHVENFSKNSHAINASIDLSIVYGSGRSDFEKNLNNSSYSDKYFNSGVMFIDCDLWRKEDIFSKFKEATVAHENSCPYFTRCELRDQCAFNIAVNGQWGRLPETYNVQKIAMHTKSWKHAAMRHYTGRRKFIPIRNRTCDPREFRLLKTISQETGLPLQSSALYDWGITYSLNGLRRFRDIVRHEAGTRELYS